VLGYGPLSEDFDQARSACSGASPAPSPTRPRSCSPRRRRSRSRPASPTA
jgi:hypothetical protein